MAVRVEAPVVPKVLVWARQSAGYEIDDVAGKLKANPKRVQSWESGESRPTVSQARKLSEIYKRPFATLLLTEPPQDDPLPPDYRHTESGRQLRTSPALLFEIRRAHFRRERAVDLYRGLDATPPKFALQISTNDDPELAGARLREFAGVNEAQQSRWKGPREAWNAWRTALEAKGVLVFLAPKISLSEMRGFSISDSEAPVIVVNSADSLTGRIFTLFHELAHIAARQEGLCDLRSDQRLETFCNAVAAAVLMPLKWFLLEPLVVASRSMVWSDASIAKLASRFSVSEESVLRRLLTAGKTSKEYYRKKRAEYLARLNSQPITDEESERPKKKGGPSAIVLAVSRVGHVLTALAIDGYRSEVLSSRDFAAVVGIRPEYIPKLEQNLWSRAGRGE